jgi:hypothetical protein
VPRSFPWETLVEICESRFIELGRNGSALNAMSAIGKAFRPAQGPVLAGQRPSAWRIRRGTLPDPFRPVANGGFQAGQGRLPTRAATIS